MFRGDPLFVESKVLHIVGDLAFAGIENWLLNVVRLKTSANSTTDIAVTGAVDPRVRIRFEGFGARILPCPELYAPLRLLRNLRRILLEYGPYDLLHSHLHRGNGHVALLGRLCGVPGIVVHSHQDSSRHDALGNAWDNWKAWTARMLQRAAADAGLACTEAAGDSLFDRRWRRRSNWHVLPCGADFQPFTRPVDRSALRAQFGLHPNAFVVGHVGRCDPVKNHDFLLNLASVYLAANADACFLLAGDGALLPELENRASQIAPRDRIRFLGAREDVPDLLLGVFDAFVFPSLSEGFSIALLEAQVAGLPVVVSDRISKESRILPQVQALSLDLPAEDWCAALDRARGMRLKTDTSIEHLRVAGCCVEDSVRSLEELYRKLLSSSALDREIRTRRPSER